MRGERVGRWPRAVVGALGILVSLTTATGCALLPSGTDGPALDEPTPGDGMPTASDEGSPTSRSDQEEPDAATIRSDGTAVALGHSTVWVLVTAVDDAGGAAGGSDPVVTVTSSGDTAASGALSEVTVTDVPATDDGERPAVHLAGPEGTAPKRLLDGSLVFRDADGVAVAGADAPVGRVEGGSTAYYEPRTDHVTVVVPTSTGMPLGTTAPPDTAASTVTLTLGLSASALVSATWGEAEGGRSLAVVPNDWLRAGSLAAQELGWSQLVANDAEADTSTMRNQYDCHALGARDKASWNLEPWRPDVGVFEVLAARCNPT